MSENLSMAELQALITVGQVAELFDVPARVVRKAAKEDAIPGVVKVLGKFGFDPEKVTEWVPPEAGERRVGVRREDGRKRYRVYLNAEELAKLTDAGFEIVDPSVAAKARRAARKAAKAVAKAGGAQVETEADTSDPFAEFGA